MMETPEKPSESRKRAFSLRFLLIYLAAPYLIGILVSKKGDALTRWLHKSPPTVSSSDSPSTGDLFSRDAREAALRKLSSPEDVEECSQDLLNRLKENVNGIENVFDDLSIVVHRNGEHRACGAVNADDIVEDFKKIVSTLSACPNWDSKYDVESFFTRFLHSKLSSDCPSVEADRSPGMGFYGFCDMGESRTPILLDHLKLVPNFVNNETLLPCHFHSHQGVRVTSLGAFASHASKAKGAESGSGKPDSTRRELHLYAVPAGRVFMFAPSHVGQIIDLPHVKGADATKPVYLEVMSLEPRVFDLVNFFTREESQTLIDLAHKEKREQFRIKRSSTGSVGYTVNARRTSESGFDTSSPTAMALKRRCFETLGYDEYIESHSDGLQLLRYNLTTSYTAHMDYMDLDDRLPHDYDSAHKGGNRYATILLYMTDQGEKDGGETVFTEAWPVGQPEEDHVEFETALQQLRDSGDASVLKRGSWQEQLVARCRSRLAIRPHAGRAVLFYSQHPNGTADRSSMHGACPMLSGTKYAANLWVWNTPRDGFPGNPRNPKFADDEVDESGFVKKTAIFANTGTNPAYEKAELYYEDQFWSKLGHGDGEVSVNTYDGHVWNVKVDGKVVKTWTIGGVKKEFVFKI